MPQERDSRFELLRIVAMTLIVVHHLLIATNHIDYARGSLRGGEMLNAFTVVGVNCFILISGYYGIRFKWRKLAFITYSILVVCGADYLLHELFPDVFNFDYAWHTIVPVCKKANWFIPAYIGLMCLAPVLNRYKEAAPVEERGRMVLGLTVLNVAAFVCNTTSVNSNGYTLVQFVYLYLLADWLRHAKSPRPWVCLGLYVLCCVLTGLYALHIHGGFQAYAYNNPLVLAASVALFLCFRRVQIQNRAINRIAETTFTVFLFHYVILYQAKAVGQGGLSEIIGPLAGIVGFVFAMAFLLHRVIRATFNRLWPLDLQKGKSLNGKE